METVTIYVDIEGGALIGVYGDKMPEGYKLNVILRDMDNVNAGDEDPIPVDYEPSELYW